MDIQRKYNTYTIVTLAALLLFSFLFPLFPTQAQEGLVPCGPGTSAGACNFCHLLALTENVINFALYYIAVPIVVIMIIVGGIFIMTAGQSPERLNKGKEIIKAALVGILIAVLAWYIIDTVLNLVAPGEANQWWNPASKISC